MVCRSEYAFYNRKTKQLDLSGMPIVTKGQNLYEAANISINLDNDEIKMRGSISGKMDQSGTPSPTPDASSTPSGESLDETISPSEALDEIATESPAASPRGKASKKNE